MKKSLEVQEVIEEIKDMLEDVINPVDTVIEIPEDTLSKSVDPKPEEETDEEISKNYESDNEEEDKWDNLQKACWTGYKQEGMKEKNGRMVPNCVPVNKSMDSEDLDKAKEKYEDVIKPRKGEPADKELYSRIVSEAKKKFDTYPSAYANGWVVQEYKRRGGTYKIQKSIWSGTFLK
jgi:hypothetical protein